MNCGRGAFFPLLFCFVFVFVFFLRFDPPIPLAIRDSVIAGPSKICGFLCTDTHQTSRECNLGKHVRSEECWVRLRWAFYSVSHIFCESALTTAVTLTTVSTLYTYDLNASQLHHLALLSPLLLLLLLHHHHHHHHQAKPVSALIQRLRDCIILH